MATALLLHQDSNYFRLTPEIKVKNWVWNLNSFAAYTVPNMESTAHSSFATANEDEQLMLKVAQGDRTAFGAIYDRFSTPLYSLALKMLASEAEAQDLLQEVFLSVWNKASTFRGDRDTAFSWVVTQLRNGAIDKIGSQRRDGEPGPDYADITDAMALEVPQVASPEALKQTIFQQLPVQVPESRKIIRFSSWIPYAIAACLMILVLNRGEEIQKLKSQLAVTNQDVARLTRSNALIGLRLAMLDVKDANFVSSKIMVAWDPNQHRGVISMQDLPAPQAGHDYQLWVLDPEAPAPISAGVITSNTSSSGFAVNPLTTQNPGFAITLEPTGGSPSPTTPILFAVAPGQ